MFIAGTTSPLDAAFGDVDGDGHVDMVVAQTDGVFYYRGHGDGTFDARVSVSAIIANGGGKAATAVAVGDLNGDGFADIVAADADPDNGNRPVHVFMSNGNGTFTARDTAPCDSENYGLAIGDYNGDGKKDLAVVAATSSDKPGIHNGLWVLLGNGDGTFQPPLTAFPGARAFAVVAGDVNNDGKDDLVTTFYDRAMYCAEVMVSKGDGTFNAPLGYSGSTPCTYATLTDIDGDGNLDLLVPDAGGAALLKGRGDGRFDGHLVYGTGGSADAICSGDFNGDGFADIAVINSDVSNVVVYYNNRDGTLQVPVAFPLADGALALAVGDLNADGKVDLVVAGTTGASVLLGSSGGLLSPVHYDAGTSSVSYCAIADLDHDGKTDVVLAANNASPQLVVLSGRGDGTLGTATDIPMADTVLSLMSGDENEDGFVDVIANCSQSLRIVVGMTDPGAALSADPNSQPDWLHPGVVCSLNLIAATNVTSIFGQFGDIPADTHLDLLYPRSANFRAYCSNGDGALPYGGLSDAANGVIALAVADMDLDGLPDVVGVMHSLQIFTGSGTTVFNTPPQEFPLSAESTGVVVADMNNDGKPDVIVLHHQGQAVSVLLRE